MRRMFAKSLQVLGLFVTGLALLYGITLASMTLELTLLMVGAGIFIAGRLIDPGD